MTVNLDGTGTPDIAGESSDVKMRIDRLITDNRIFLCLMEAKNRERGQRLQDFIPQAAAESIATYVILQTSLSRILILKLLCSF